jgi:pseudaminic acid synthase
MTDSIRIGGRSIGIGHPTYIIAELSANHQGSFDKAAELVSVAAESGADAVKLQTYTADTLTIDSDQPWFKIEAGTVWDGTNLHALYREAFTPWEWQPRLKKIADDLGIHCFSSPFDFTAVDFLEKMDVPAYKIASFELIDIPLIKRVARTGKPMIMSTGMATLSEIDEAVGAARGAGASEIALLKCTSAYPAPASEANLRTIPHLAESFDVVAGLSDHTLGIAVPVVAASLGARIIEKHFCLSRDEPGPDSSFSLEPAELKAMVESVRVAEDALGTVRYQPTEKERASRSLRRSLFVVEDVKRGEVFSAANVRSIRPGAGLHTRHLDEVMGQRARVDVARGTPLAWEHVDPAVASDQERGHS